MTLEARSEVEAFWSGTWPGWVTVPLVAITHPTPSIAQQLSRQPPPGGRTLDEVLAALAQHSGDCHPGEGRHPGTSKSTNRPLAVSGPCYPRSYPIHLAFQHRAHQSQSEQNPNQLPAQSYSAQRQAFAQLLPALVRIGYTTSEIPSGELHTVMNKVDQVVAPIMHATLPEINLIPQHPKYLWYLLPVLAFLASQGALTGTKIATILSLLTPPVVIVLAGAVDSPKKPEPHTSAPAMPPTPSPVSTPDFTQQLLVWIHQQPSEKWDSLTKSFHLALITAQVAPPGFQ